MAKGTFTITLADGTQLAGLELNGNNFISKSEIKADTFHGKLAHVTITGDLEKDSAGLIGEHTNMELIRCEYDAGLGGYAFVLREIPAAELEKVKMQGDIAYLSMMTGYELD